MLDVKAEEELKEYENSYWQYFDTILNFTIYSYTKVPEEHWDEIENILIYVENTFSRHIDESELAQLNASAGKGPFTASEGLFNVIKKAIDFADLTDGKYNPAIGPLIDLWGPDMIIDRVPTEEEFDAIKDLLKYDEIKLDPDTRQITLPLEGMEIDLGSIAKGYAADLLRDKIIELGYEHAIINLGTSSISLIGERYEEKKGSRYWNIGIKNPNPKFLHEDTHVATIGIIDQTVTTSGTDQRYWYVKGNPKKKYHHILDPDTGYPVHNIIEQVTVISNDATIGDALSTSLKAVGIKKGIELIETLKSEGKEVDAIFVTYNREVYVTSGIGKDIPFEISHNTFKIKNHLDLTIEDEKNIVYFEPESNIKKQLLIVLGIIVGTSSIIGLTVLAVKKFRKY